MKKPNRAFHVRVRGNVLEFEQHVSPMASKEDTKCYLPTPEEIEAGCAEIQRGWRFDDDRRINKFEIPTASRMFFID